MLLSSVAASGRAALGGGVDGICASGKTALLHVEAEDDLASEETALLCDESGDVLASDETALGRLHGYWGR